MAPEIISEQGHNELADWWSLGILMFELATGVPPYDDADLERLADKICFDDLPLRSEFSRDFSDLLLKLTHKVRTKRLGSKGGATQIKAHPFFKTVEWDKLLSRQVRAPFLPDPAAENEPDPDCPSKGLKNPYVLLSQNFDK